jgi:MoaA/NifB/PqqE/SkfB family radical SAM enzyme
MPDTMDIGGGEPLSLPWTLDLIRAFPEIQWGLSTNGLNGDKIEELIKHPIKQIININASYHPDAAKQYEWYDGLWKLNVMRLTAAGYTVHPNLQNTPRNVRLAQWAIDWLKTQNMHMVISPMCYSGKLNAQTRNDGLKCDAGIYHKTIGPDGTAWPCLSGIWSNQWAETSIGNYVDGTIDLNKRQSPCRIYCADFYQAYQEHEGGDYWELHIREGEKCAV